MKTGTLMMIGFWLSAVGGILTGVLWLRRRNPNPVPKAEIRASLKKRLEAGELDRAEYDKRLRDLDRT